MQLWDAKDTLYVLIRARPHTAEELLELRVAVVGNVDAGKSTLLGVLTKGRLDDGRGKARVALFRHKHEIETGRTSSVGMEIMGFGPNGREVTAEMQQAAAKADPNHKKKDLSWDEICKEAAKVIGFIDLAGHERYFKVRRSRRACCPSCRNSRMD
jgi:GTPase